MNLFALLFFAMILCPASLILSILAWRLKTENMFWFATGTTALLFLIFLLNGKEILELFQERDTMFYGVVAVACLAIPICFLVASKLKPDKAHADSDVTDEYLNDIINSKDEDHEME